MSRLSDVSVLLALPLFAVAFAGAAVAAHSLLRQFVSPERLSEHHEVAGFLMGVVGVLYSVVLGFLVGTVWTAFASAQQTSDLEAGYVADTFNFAGQLDPPQRRQLQRIVAQYAIDVRNARWSGQAKEDSSGPLLYRAFQMSLPASGPAKRPSLTAPRGDTIRNALFDSLRNVADTRRLRLIQSRSRLPAGMLEALVLGATAVITFTFFFGVRNYFKQMAMTALLAGTIGLFFGLIVELSTPYSGPIQVSRDAWTYVIDANRLSEFAK